MLSREEWLVHVNDFKQNGHSNARGFCASRQIGYQAFRYWLQKTTQNNAVATIDLKPEKLKGNLLPVIVQGQTSAKLHLCVNEVELFLEPNFDAPFLKSVITVLKEC